MKLIDIQNGLSKLYSDKQAELRKLKCQLAEVEQEIGTLRAAQLQIEELTDKLENKSSGKVGDPQ
jgi:prefoldin subunit 5